jgi:hypothetical protein
MAFPKESRPKATTTLAVIMGDIVDSEKSESRRALSKIFNSAIATANKNFKKLLASPLTITLGDEFQGLVESTSAGFEIIANLRLNLLARGVSCRFVLGEVHLDTEINPNNAWNMMGEGLAPARAKLNDKQDSNVYRFLIQKNPPLERLLNATGDSLSMVEKDWTGTQLKYVLLRRELETVDRVASRLGISGRSVYKVLEAANWAYYAEQKAAILFALSYLDNELTIR